MHQVPVTQRLYYTDSYVSEFEASVTDQRDQGSRIYLDRTAFYPTSGGQPFDTGNLNGIEVTDVIDEGHRIAHCLSGPLTAHQVRGQLDWSRRFDHMQQHTGQHLLSAVLEETLKLPTLAVHFGKESSTVDLDGLLSPEQVALVEERANQIIAENRPVIVSFEEAREAIGLRKPPTREGTIRIITIEGLDRSACGGTHVRHTGEIGSILLRRTERVKRAVRLEFLCGLRAVRAARADYELLSGLASDCSASAAELPRLMAAQREQLKLAGSSRRELEEKLHAYRARELYTGTAPDASGIRRTVVREQSGTLNELRGLAQAYASLPSAIFVGVVDLPPAILLAASPDSGVNAGAVLKSLLESNGGKGGGSATLAQGTLSDPSRLEPLVESLTAGRS